MLTDSTGANDFYIIENAEPDEDGLIECPVVPLREGAIFPNVISPIALTGKRAINGAEASQEPQPTIIGVAQIDPNTVDPGADKLYTVGVEIALGRILRLPDNSFSALGQGRRRVEIVRFTQTRPYLIAKARPLAEINPNTRRTNAMMQAVLNLFKRAIELNDNIPEEVLLYALNANNPGWLADLIGSTLTLPAEERQRLLETLNVEERLDRVAELLSQELSVLELKDEITSQVHQEMDRTQREIYLREQMRVIQNELGEEDVFQQEISEVREQIAQAQLPPEVNEKALKELSRLAMMPPMSPEVGIVRTYIDWLTGVPWHQATEDQLEVATAQDILDREHYGLPKVKDRILEYIAVRRLAPDEQNSPILCFVGPPGVGKTSLGKSIASALGREFVRVSLGGVRDEAEIRGHRRTYIGAMPGRIVQTMRRAGTVNPVFMLDEIDKLGMDFRGDPAAALLEILDPEQNFAFSDHYLDVPYDLSKVLFITTANELDPLPPALLDRLELIDFPGYIEEEKIAIARQFLIPKAIQVNGLTDHKVHFSDSALRTLIREYTYEAGVRNLNREIANVCRKVARQVAEKKRHPARIDIRHLNKFLGPAPFDDLRANDKDEIGVTTGMAWTPFGGDILTIEVQVLAGKGTLLLTGSLGDVMQESAQAALSYMRSRAEDLGVPFDDFDNLDVHVHVPEGAVPKDGPSAGITLATSIISAFTERKVRSDFAMTGEITLRGKVLPIGGVKEKVLAAHRARIKHIILPKMNERDMVDVPKETRQQLDIHYVENMQEVLDLVLLPEPTGERRLERIRRERDKDSQDDES
ncbi:MAG: endopeptidase La [Anaerolineae bacterium]|nr:endopeptidase La [Anaerolineae bacterium]